MRVEGRANSPVVIINNARNHLQAPPTLTLASLFLLQSSQFQCMLIEY